LSLRNAASRETAPLVNLAEPGREAREFVGQRIGLQRLAVYAGAYQRHRFLPNRGVPLGQDAADNVSIKAIGGGLICILPAPAQGPDLSLAVPDFAKEAWDTLRRRYASARRRPSRCKFRLDCVEVKARACLHGGKFDRCPCQLLNLPLDEHEAPKLVLKPIPILQ
jgi:hypothetical protein